MNQPTPGPWRFDPENKGIVDTTNTLLQVSGCSMPCGYVPDDHVSYANARLIAAAPELLEAVRAYMFVEQTLAGKNPHKLGTNRHFAFEKARAAIAKAEGEL